MMLLKTGLPFFCLNEGQMLHRNNRFQFGSNSGLFGELGGESAVLQKLSSAFGREGVR